MADLPDLETLRISIERIDTEILDALRRRMDLADDIARTKLAAAAPLRDPRREDLVLRKVREAAARHGWIPMRSSASTGSSWTCPWRGSSR